MWVVRGGDECREFTDLLGRAHPTQPPTCIRDAGLETGRAAIVQQHGFVATEGKRKLDREGEVVGVFKIFSRNGLLVVAVGDEFT